MHVCVCVCARARVCMFVYVPVRVCVRVCALNYNRLYYYYCCKAAEATVACSHERSYELFTESINSQCPFMAYPCTSGDEFHKSNCLRCHGNDCSQMGFNADKYSARGSLFLETAASSTYCGKTDLHACVLIYYFILSLFFSHLK